MAKIKLTHKSGHKAAAKAAKGAGPLDFNLQDNGDNTYTVLGVDAAGNQLDISGIASLTPAPTSDNPGVTVDVPSPMTVGVHAAVPAPAIGTVANLAVTATWTDGSVGPFTIAFTETVTAGPANSIVLVPGAVTVH